MALCACARGSATADRRRFLTWAALGGGAALLGAGFPGRAWGAAKAEYFLLNCIDYRLTAATTRYMEQRGLMGDYDQLILAGASIGVATDRQPDWAATFWETLDLARRLHGVSHLILLDHRDCGAYTLVLGEDFAKKPAAETRIHAEMTGKVAAMVRQRHPEISTEALLMALDGTVERLSPG
jgi:carbonic anhydrase